MTGREESDPTELDEPVNRPTTHVVLWWNEMIEQCVQRAQKGTKREAEIHIRTIVPSRNWKNLPSQNSSFGNVDQQNTRTQRDYASALAPQSCNNP